MIKKLWQGINYKVKVIREWWNKRTYKFYRAEYERKSYILMLVGTLFAFEVPVVLLILALIHFGGVAAATILTIMFVVVAYCFGAASTYRDVDEHERKLSEEK
jgi:hypothetical protein